MPDPLLQFHSIYKYDRSAIASLVAGEKYVGVMLRDGRIGVCSTLQTRVAKEDTEMTRPDLGRHAHRIIYNAYLNARLNYDAAIEDRKDIFDHHSFGAEDQVVMIGYFRPLVKKFQDAGIPLSIFDLMDEDDILSPPEHLHQSLQHASKVILTSTSIANGTFEGIVQQTARDCEVFLLGPSSVLHSDLLVYRNIKRIYGALFGRYDTRVLDLITAGHGTQSFMKYGQKVNI